MPAGFELDSDKILSDANVQYQILVKSEVQMAKIRRGLNLMRDRINRRKERVKWFKQMDESHQASGTYYAGLVMERELLREDLEILVGFSYNPDGV